MITTSIFPGRYVQGAGAAQKLGIEMARFGNMGYLVCDPFVYDNILPDFHKKIENEVKILTEKFEGECSDEEISRLTKAAKAAGCEFVAGIGGGKTLDTVKAIAHSLRKPVVIVPTLASTDAPCSSLSVIYTPQGEFKRYLFLPKNPDLVLVDTEIIAQAPARFLRCGMGDALSTWFEADSCHRTLAKNMTGNPGSMTAQALARLCYDTLLEYGQAALVSAEAHVVTPALEHVVEANTLLSGLGFESGGLAACHSIHNGLTVLKETHHLYHGEKVAFGVLATLFLTDRPGDIIDEVFSFCISIGLPTTFEEMGINNSTDEELMRVGEAACAEGETIHNEAGTITAKAVVAALRAADGEGRRRKNLLKSAMIIFLMVLFTEMYGQIKTGYIFGMNLSTMTLKYKGIFYDAETPAGVHFGGRLEIPVQGNFTFQPAFVFSAKGADYKIDTLDVSMAPVYIEIPVIAVYSFGSDAIKISLFTGPYFACSIGGYKIVSGGELKNINFGSGENDDLKPFDIGLSFGAGVNINGFMISAQYGIGLSNLSPEPEEDSEIKNRVIGISISSLFPVK